MQLVGTRFHARPRMCRLTQPTSRTTGTPGAEDGLDDFIVIAACGPRMYVHHRMLLSQRAFGRNTMKPDQLLFTCHNHPVTSALAWTRLHLHRQRLSVEGDRLPLTCCGRPVPGSRANQWYQSLLILPGPPDATRPGPRQECQEILKQEYRSKNMKWKFGKSYKLF